jgi:glycolate oxidase iron-sulfur subunit
VDLTVTTLPVARSPGFTIPDAPSVADLNQCVHCGLCLPHCPTFRELHVETESPRGRLHLMCALGEGRVDTTDLFVQHMSLCLDCRACEAACPSGVKFGLLMEATRAEIRARRPGSRAARLLRWLVFRQLMPHPGRLAALGALLRAYQRLGLRRALRAISPRLVGAHGVHPPAAYQDADATQPAPVQAIKRLIEAEQLLPRLSSRFFCPRGTVAPQGLLRRRVAFFAGCIMRLAFAETNRASVRVLARNGCSVALPSDQVCCGALHVHAGDREMAKELARRNIAAFESSASENVVVNAAGCGAVLKEYGELLAHDPLWAERARAFSVNVRDFSELLAELPLDPPRASIRARVTYQDACHLAHAQRIKAQPRDAIRSIPGVELVEMADADRCCGSAGIYNLTEPELAGRLGLQKAENVAAARADVVVSGNPGCLMQLRATLAQLGAPTRAVHLAELLDAAYRAE